MASSSKNNSFDNIRGSEQILQLLSEYDELESESDIDDTNADANYEVSEHDTSSEQEANSNDEFIQVNESSEDEIQPTGNSTNYFYGRGREKFKWSKIAPSRNVRTAAHNIIGRMHLPGVKGPARLLGRECNELEVWKCIFTEDMLTEIVIRTNEKLANVRSKYSKDRTELNDVDVIELRALIGLLYYSAVFKSNNEDLEALFSTDGTGRDIFRATLSLKRTLTLLACLRFDDKTDREVRQVNDRGAAISWLFNKFVFNSQ